MQWPLLLILDTIILRMCVIAGETLTRFKLEHVCYDCCYGTKLATYYNIQSVMVCSVLCSMTPECRSLQYNPDNSRCWTNAEIVTNVNTTCSTRIRYGKRFKASTAFRSCDSDGDCPADNTTCHGGRCELKDALPYATGTTGVPRGCTGSTFQQMFVYMTNTLVKYQSSSNTSLEQCKAMCLSTCRFIAMKNTKKQSTCFLYEYEANPSYTTNVSVVAPFRLWSRHCA